MGNGHVVVMVNYHRIGATDPDNPLHRLHTVSTEVFGQQVDYMQHHGKIVSLEDVRAARELADVNYVISFDDVPSAALTGIDLLRERGLPVTLSPCAQLTTHGWGTRDKVYAIEKYVDAADLNRAVAAWLRRYGLVIPDPGSFYHFTKRDDLDRDLLSARLIDPLFATVEAQARPYLADDTYLGWDTIARLAQDPGITVANHGLSHDNLAAVSRARLAHDITTSHDIFREQLGFHPQYFTLPFGRYTQQLALDCVQILYPLDYDGLLWVGEAGTRIRAPYTSQLLQVTRLHAPTTLDSFIRRAEEHGANALDAAVWQLPARPRAVPVTIAESSDPAGPAGFEMVVRQGKDYACDPAFYAYQFTTNPAKSDRPDHYTARSDGQIHAIAYNFHTRFTFGATVVSGVYLSGWRKLPQTNPAAAGRLIQKMLAREPIVGVYRPSSSAAPAFEGWHRISVCDLEMPVVDHPSNPQAECSPYFDDRLRPLGAALTERAGFTVTRDETYYRWRHETYPLATARYVLLLRQGKPAAYAVTHQRDTRISVADMYAPTDADHCELIAAVMHVAHASGARTLHLQTSALPLAGTLRQVFGGIAAYFENFYHLNPARLAAAGVLEPERQWSKFRFHESTTTGDVLIK